MNIIPHHLITEMQFSDYYCGAGGSSSGLKKAGIEGLIASNHWKLAIATHNTNHPEIAHVLADLMISNPAMFPYTDIAWFSPECTKHSRGQGKKRKNRSQLDFINKALPDPSAERSRVTMWDVERFTEYHRYQAVIVENVVDVRDWEPYQNWLGAISSLGYEYKECFFNSRFFHPVNGQNNYSPQNRDRLYVVFWRKGNKAPNLDFRPWAYCYGCEKNVKAMQVFKKPVPSVGEVLYDTTGKRGQYYYGCPDCFSDYKGKPVPRRVEPFYFAAYNIIDWSLPCPPIGERDKPLKPKTMNRIRIGLEKFGRQPLIIQMAYSHARNNRATILHDPIPTQATRQELAFIMPFKGEQTLQSPSETMMTIAAHGGPALVTVPYILSNRGDPKYQNLQSISDPLPTILTGDNLALVEFYGGGNLRPITDVLNGETAGGVKSGLLISPSYLVAYYRRDNTASGMETPIPTIPGENRFGLVTTPFMTAYNSGSDGIHGVNDPVYTVTGNDRHNLVIPDVDIDSCGFRMLEPEECKLGQGFDHDYVILGSRKKDQVKQIGNAVSDPVAQYLGQQVLEALT